MEKKIIIVLKVLSLWFEEFNNSKKRINKNVIGTIKPKILEEVANAEKIANKIKDFTFFFFSYEK